MSGNLFDEERSGSAAMLGGWITAYCDGGSRGNPGPAGFGAVVTGPEGQELARLSQFLGVQTNNYAEYSGLLAVLKWAREHGYRRLKVVSDSELMVKQMKGQYKVASPVLRPLWEEARGLSRQFDGFQIAHTLRGGNKEADRLANEAMDKGMGKSSGVSGASGTRANAYERPAARPGQQPAAGQPKPPSQVLEGYVKGGVVHPLEGELPDGIFVKIVRE